LARWTIGEDGGGSLEADVSYSGDEATLTVEARGSDEELLNELALEATVVGPAGAATNLSLRQVGPGRYEAAFVPAVEGAYLIRLVDQTGDQAEKTGQTTGWVLGYSSEYSHLTGDEQLLATISQLTGGRDLAEQFGQGDFGAVLAHDLPAEKATQPIWPWLLLVATVLLPLDIALRRIVLDRSDIRRLWQATAGRFWRPARPASMPSEQVARLFQAKERAARRASGEPVDNASMVATAGEAAGPATEAPGSRGKAAGDAGGADKIGEAPDERPGESNDTLAARLLERRKRGDSDNV
jgi:hypothetical protein